MAPGRPDVQGLADEGRGARGAFQAGEKDAAVGSEHVARVWRPGLIRVARCRPQRSQGITVDDGLSPVVPWLLSVAPPGVELISNILIKKVIIYESQFIPTIKPTEFWAELGAFWESIHIFTCLHAK